MQSIPLLSPLNPSSAVAPLIFVLALSMIREGVEDYKRWRSDKRDNGQLTHRFEGDNFHKCKWEDLKAGDFIRIDKEETISADVLVMLSSSPSGISYV
jgi:magnesium-transporting ATPase (P-type)